jgi:hypothetical protein
MANLRRFIKSLNLSLVVFLKVSPNEFALGAVADFGAKNFQATNKADAR